MADKIALVTGAGKRLGAAMAKSLGADGYSVIVHYNTSQSDAGAVVDAIVDAGGKARPVQCDLGDPHSVQQFVKQIGPVDVLINSASVFEFDDPDALDAAMMQRALNINLVSPSLLASAMAAHHTARNSGCIINLLDQKLFNLNPDFFSYTLSKAGLHAATQTMAMAYAPRIRVNAIAPGITLPSASQSETAFKAAHALNPMGGGATPDDIVRTMHFILATPSMTGETIIIDGGQHLDARNRDVMFDKD